MDEFVFKVICRCGSEITGTFLEGAYSDTLFCECGLVWVIPRPVPEHLTFKFVAKPEGN